jgi:hypothetical protein
MMEQNVFVLAKTLHECNRLYFLNWNQETLRHSVYWTFCVWLPAKGSNAGTYTNFQCAEYVCHIHTYIHTYTIMQAHPMQASLRVTTRSHPTTCVPMVGRAGTAFTSKSPACGYEFSAWLAPDRPYKCICVLMAARAWLRARASPVGRSSVRDFSQLQCERVHATRTA